MLIKKQTEKDHTERRAGYPNVLIDAAVVLGGYSDEISCRLLRTRAFQVGTCKKARVSS